MSDEIMDKRANGAGRDRPEAGRTATRGDGPRKTRNLCAEFRQHFDDFEDACWRAPSLEGPGAAAIWRQLAARLEASIGVAAQLLPVLQADIIDQEKGSKSVADDLPSKQDKEP